MDDRELIGPNYSSEGPSYAQGNPLIEALLPLPTPIQLPVVLAEQPEVDFDRADANPFIAVCEIATLHRLVLPRPEAVLVAARVYAAITQAYAEKNPLLSDTQRSINEINQTAIEVSAKSKFTAPIVFLLGWSGMGKSTLIYSVLRTLPKVIRHRSYAGSSFECTQVVWLSCDASIRASPKGLILGIAKALDDALGLQGASRYSEQFGPRGGSIHTQILLLTIALASHHVGIVHIDDVQRLGEGTLGDQTDCSSMLISMCNVAGVALVLSGTVQALHVLGANFEVARRSLGRGLPRLVPSADNNDPYYRALLATLFRYQFAAPCELDGDLIEWFSEHTAAITAVTVALYVAAQEVAVLSGQPMSKSLIIEVYDDQFRELKTALAVLNRIRKDGAETFATEADEQVNAFLNKRSDRQPTRDSRRRAFR
jgi:hypothetical protein